MTMVDVWAKNDKEFDREMKVAHHGWTAGHTRHGRHADSRGTLLQVDQYLTSCLRHVEKSTRKIFVPREARHAVRKGATVRPHGDDECDGTQGPKDYRRSLSPVEVLPVSASTQTPTMHSAYSSTTRCSCRRAARRRRLARRSARADRACRAALC
jgi:hypothetical protein